MKLLIDTNVILDVLLRRRPFYENSAEVLKMAVKELIEKLLKVVSVAAVSESKIINALDLDWKDFEDSVQYSVAKFTSMDGIVTRNTADYEENKIPIWTPEQVLDIWAEKGL